jgi:GT2 family glycosyltransferase
VRNVENGVPRRIQELAAIGRELARAVDAARATLDVLEEERARVLDELNETLVSPSRVRLLGMRRRALAVLAAAPRPFDALAGVVFRLLAAAGLERFREFSERLRYRACHLRDLPEVGRDSDQPDPAQAIRWLGLVQIGHGTRRALFCHPTSAVSFRTTVTGPARVRADCALLPNVWRDNVGGVEFTLSVRAVEGAWQAHRTRRVDPGGRFRDRRWRTLQLSLPPSGGEFVITLATRLPVGAGTAFPWAIWGDPRLLWPRTFGALVRAATAEIRRGSWRDTLARLRDLARSDEAALIYRQWLRAHAPEPRALAEMAASVSSLSYRPLISVITPVYNTDPRWLRACIESVRRQVYPHWELCLADDGSDRAETLAVLDQYRDDPRIKRVRLSRRGHIVAASNAALAQATGDFVAFLDHDDALAPEALYEVVRCLNDHPDADFIYTDEDKLDEAGLRCDPFFKPDWSPEMFLSYMYTCHLMVLRRALVDQVGRFREGYEGAQDYDLALRVVARTERIYHVPKVLYHWRKVPGSAAAENAAKPWALEAAKRALEDHLRRTGLDAEVLPGAAPGLFRVRHRLRGQPRVTIIVPTDDRSREIYGRVTPLLPHCIRSVVQKTAYSNYELLIVDNGRLSAATEAFLRSVPHRRVSFLDEGPFNFARKLNFAVSHATGEHLVIFNDDLEVIASEWLTALLEYSQQEGVGAVGAKLLFPDGRLQHVGMVLGVCGVAAHAYHMQPGSTVGHGGSAVVVRNYSAVTGACMMTRRAVFDAVGGFDERFPIDFNDVDYCLRLRRAGYRVVFTPYALLYHHEAGTLGPRVQDRASLAEMRRTWGAVLDRDPYYNPNLTRAFPDFRLRSPAERPGDAATTDREDAAVTAAQGTR